jgi:hypothetical protein
MEPRHAGAARRDEHALTGQQVLACDDALEQGASVAAYDR